jgi:AcrR family transcriptional regulator
MYSDKTRHHAVDKKSPLRPPLMNFELPSASMPTNTARRGRRSGRPDTRRTILTVARRQFLHSGYAAVTMRSIAAEAQVDPALLSHYFGSKKGLFGASLALTANPAELLEQMLASGDLDSFPERVIRQVVTAWEDPNAGPALLNMMRSYVQDEAVATLVREAFKVEIVDRITALVGGRYAHEHATAFTSIVAGLITTRYLLRLEPTASMSQEDVIQVFATQLRRTLTVPRRAPAARRMY